MLDTHIGARMIFPKKEKGGSEPEAGCAERSGS
jgi:hypothetical protein